MPLHASLVKKHSINWRNTSCFWPGWSIRDWKMWADSMLTLMTVAKIQFAGQQQHLICSQDLCAHWPSWQPENCHAEYRVSPHNEHWWVYLSPDWWMFLAWTQKTGWQDFRVLIQHICQFYIFIFLQMEQKLCWTYKFLSLSQFWLTWIIKNKEK